VNYVSVCRGHSVITDELKRHLFIDGQRVACPAAPTQVDIDGTFGGDCLVVAKSHEPGDAFVVNAAGRFAWLGPCAHIPKIERQLNGRYLVAFVTSTTHLRLVDVSQACEILKQDDVALPPYRIGASGVLDVQGRVVTLLDDEIWNPDGTPKAAPEFAGVTGRYVTRRGMWTVFQGLEVGGVLAFSHQRDRLYRVSHAPTVHPPRLALAGADQPNADDCLVGISFGVGLLIGSDDFEAYVPDVVTPPPPPPPPPPEELMISQQDGERIVNELHHDFPPPRTVDGAFNFARRVATRLKVEGAGMFLKPDCAGENIAVYNGRAEQLARFAERCFRSSRIIFPSGHVVKVLTDVPTTNGPSWQVAHEPENLQFRVDAIAPDDAPGEPDQPPPPPDGALEIRVANLERHLRETDVAFTAVLENVKGDLRKVSERVSTLEGRPPGGDTSALEGRIEALEGQLARGFKGRVGAVSIAGLNRTLEVTVTPNMAGIVDDVDLPEDEMTVDEFIRKLRRAGKGN